MDSMGAYFLVLVFSFQGDPVKHVEMHPVASQQACVRARDAAKIDATLGAFPLYAEVTATCIPAN